MASRTHTSVYGRKHIHDHVKTLAQWRKKTNPAHTISEEFDRLLLAGIKATYNQDVPLDLPESKPNDQPPAPAVS